MSGAKQGVEFIPVDIDIFDDNKIYLLQRRYPCKGFYYLMVIWAEIFRNSYYLSWDPTTKEKFCSRIQIDQEDFQEVLDYILELELMNPQLYEDYKILTSYGIQIRWMKAVKRRTSVTMNRLYVLVKQEEIDQVKVKRLIIEDANGEVEKRPVRRSKVKAEPEDMPPVDDPQPEFTVGAHTIEFVKDFIKIPYDDRNSEFKQEWPEAYYKSYQWFSSLIINDYPTLHRSTYQVSLKEYRELYKEYKWDKPDMIATLDTLTGSGNIQPDTVLKNKLKAFLKPIMAAKSRAKSNTPVPKKETVLYDATKN